MKISIALTTYNGEKYIFDLLNSLYEQSESVDEVIIADDCSTDNTTTIVNDFINEKELQKKWHFYVNEKNLGYKKNFLNCMKRTSGDLIFLSDQDDIWNIEKVHIMTNILKNHEEINVLVCREDTINSNNDIIKKPKNIDGSLEKIKFVTEIKKCVGAGHLMVIRRGFCLKYADLLLKRNLTFDVPFALAASLNESFYQLNSNLVSRRLHENNASGIKHSGLDKARDYNRVLAGRKCRLDYYKFVKFLIETEKDKSNYAEFYEFIEILEKSYIGIKNRKMIPLIKEFFSSNIYLNKMISLGGLLSLLIG